MNLMHAHTLLCENFQKVLGAPTQCIQTHISTILLSGEVVYKLKKPVDFGFLDYSTLEKRHHCCLEELRINRCYAPTLYLGVVAVTGSIENPEINGEGELLDFAVKMRRFEQDDQLDHLAERGELGVDLVEKMARLVAASHGSAVPVESASDYGEPQRVLAPMEENFALLGEMAADDMAVKLETLKRWTHEQSEKLEPLLKRRKKEGFIRECHGDMHLHNMALFENELILFDAIEFNPYLNHIDIISDLAFLVMDLEYRGLLRHSRRLTNRYLEITGDYDGVALLDFYKTYRAMVRAKVAALRLAQELSPEEERKVTEEVRRYTDLALGYTRKKSGFLAITHGFSGSGKSTFALMAVENFGAIRIRSDVERMRMFETGIYTAEATRATYDRLAEIAGTVTAAGYRAIVDATFLKSWQRRIFSELATGSSLTFVLLDLQCDVQIMCERIEKRTSEGRDVSEADLEVLEMQMRSAEPLSDDETEAGIRVDCSTKESMQRFAEALSLMLIGSNDVDPSKIERRILELSLLVKEVAVIVHENRLFCLIRPDFEETAKAGIVNIENEIRWYAVELYNMEAEEEEKIRGYKILKGEFPKTVGGEIDRGRLEELFAWRENLPDTDVIKLDDEVFNCIQKYLQSVTKESVYPSSHLELDLGLDSLDYVQLFVFIEKSFGVFIDEKQFSGLMVLRDLCTYVEERKRKIEPNRVSWSEILNEKIEYELLYSPVALRLFKTLFLPLFRLYFRLEISGSQNLPTRPFIIAPSHQSMMDGFLMAAALPYGVLTKTFFLAFDGVFGTRTMRPISRNGQMVLINDNRELKESMQRCSVVLHKGLNLVVFPEGARTRDRKLLPFKPFFAILAKELNVPIVPVVLDGSFEALPAGKLMPRPAKITIRYLEPIYSDGLDYKELTEKVKSVIREGMKR